MSGGQYWPEMSTNLCTCITNVNSLIRTVSDMSVGQYWPETSTNLCTCITNVNSLIRTVSDMSGDGH
jgi:hypothetical protein